MNQKIHRLGSTQRKIMTFLAAGLAIGLSHSPKKQRWIIKQIPKEFRKIDRQAIERAINSLYASHLVKEMHHRNGDTTLILSQAGKQRAIRFNLDNMKIKPVKKWNGDWNIVMFDIPERLKKVREALRFHFREIGLIELQKSVLVSPFPCQDEIEYILEFYNARKYVRFIVAKEIDNQLHLMKKFNLC